MAIKAEIILDSVNPDGNRLTTVVLEFPRIVLAEFNTHRMLSRNAASSRAIPVKKMIDRIKNDPFIPVKWGTNKPGMQASDEVLEGADLEYAIKIWLLGRDYAIDHAELLSSKLHVHKQIANRLLEPWMWTTVVMSCTDIANFFALRDHPKAEPHMELLAKALGAAYRNSVPTVLQWGQWHLPFIRPDEWSTWPVEDLIKFSTARSARVSYLNHDGSTPAPEKDFALHNDLVVSRPLHASPAEHPAQAEPGKHGNFNGWKQYRKTLDHENITTHPYCLRT